MMIAFTPVAFTPLRYVDVTTAPPAGTCTAQICAGSVEGLAVAEAASRTEAAATSVRGAALTLLIFNLGTRSRIPRTGDLQNLDARPGTALLRQLASARPASGTFARAPPTARDASTASIMRTTSSPIEADDRGAIPERIDEQKSVSSSWSGSAAATRGERMSPVR